MNPGYLSFFCLFIVAVLGWMGLFDEFLSRLQLQKRAFFLLLISICLTSAWYIPLYADSAVSIGTFVLPLGFFCFLWGKEERDSRTYTLAAALLTGVTLFLFRYMLQLDPVLRIVDEVYLIAAVTAVLSIVISRRTEQTLSIIGLGLMFMEILVQFLLRAQVQPIVLGDFSFRDALIFSMLFALLLHSVVFNCIEISVSLARKALVKRSR
jgi:hypothetical protein